MKTYQDWEKVAGQSERERMEFVKAVINEHKASPVYRQAADGERYYAGQNTTIKRYEKFLFNAMGQAVPDTFSANHKLASRFFYRTVMQANSTLLGNGITWKNGKGDKALGDDIDKKIIEAGRNAQVGGVTFGFYNNGKVEIYRITEFAPLYDEEDGALKAGVRFWQVDAQKPLRATLFEIDGYTEYLWDKDHMEGMILQDKRPYIIVKQSTEAFGDEIYDFQNYPTFPVVPCWANDLKQSELLPIRSTIDAYDLINSGYANDIDDANLIYWTITNAGGMDDVDLVQFLDKLRKMHAAQTDDDQQITAHSVDVPYNGREAILERLEKQLYKDSMSLNTYDIAGGAVTATQIEAAYEPLNEKLDAFEAQITAFLMRLLAVAGVEDEPTYTRSTLANRAEDIAALISGAMYLDSDYITTKIMTLFGDKDLADQTILKMNEDNFNRLTGGSTEMT